jgi:glycerophosphoryl diester phosphodiesterase
METCLMYALAMVTALFIGTGALLADEPWIVAHRGASRDAPENTLPAFRLAWEQGADAIEGDFLLTSDRRIVCIHDKDTQRVAGRNLVVRDTTLAELRKLDVGTWHGPSFAGTNTPTLAEVFATVPAGKRVYVEVKCGREIVPVLLQEVGRSKLDSNQIVVIAFDREVIRDFKKAAPKYRAFWLASFKADESGALKPELGTVLKTLEEVGADGLGSSPGISESTAKGVLAAGFEWHVWTVDDPIAARRLRDWGVKSITTNVPGQTRKSLAE